MALRNVRIELNRDGGRPVLNSPGVKRDLEERAERIAAAAGPGMKASVWKGADRYRATIRAETREARLAEAENRALTRSLEAGR